MKNADCGIETKFSSLRVCVKQFSSNGVVLHVKHERLCMTTFPKPEKRVQNTTRCRVFLTNFEVIVNVVKHCLECLTYLLKQN